MEAISLLYCIISLICYNIHETEMFPMMRASKKVGLHVEQGKHIHNQAFERRVRQQGEML